MEKLDKFEKQALLGLCLPNCALPPSVRHGLVAIEHMGTQAPQYLLLPGVTFRNSLEGYRDL